MSGDDRSSNGCIIGPGRWCGTAGGYTNHNCRCAACTDAFRQAHNEYMYRTPEQREKKRQFMAAQRGGYKVGPRGDQSCRSYDAT